MINTTAQNKYFKALNVMARTGQYDNKIDNLLDEMFAEFDHNIIGLGFDESKQLSGIIFARFVNVNLNRIFRDHANKFYDTRQMKISLHGLDKYGMEKSPSGLSIYKYKPEDNRPQKNRELQIKLKWGGSKTQMYHVIRQLKSNNVLVSSYEDIGLFLIQNIDKFDGSELTTVINELQKKKYDQIPHGKRIDLSELKELNED